LITADMHESIIEVLSVLGVIGVGLAGIAAILKYTRLKRLGSYIWRQLVSDPLGKWFKKTTGEAVEESLNYRNDGESFRDQIDALTEGQIKLANYGRSHAKRSDKIEEVQRTVLTTLDSLKDCQEQTNASLQDIRTAVIDHSQEIESLEDGIENLEELVTE